jgi:hypothetical protein
LVTNEAKWSSSLKLVESPTLRGALSTAMTLFGGLLVGLLAGSLTFRLIPGSNVNDVRLGHAAIAATPAVIGIMAGGAFWGRQMGQIAQTNHMIRLTWAGALGFGPVAALLALGLGIAEPAIVARLSQLNQPIHRVFTLLFVPSAFLIAGISAWAIGLALRDNKLAWSLLWQVGLTAGVTFLIINLGMEAMGWVIGAPGAAERATMLTVMSLGNFCAAITGGALMGWQLNKIRK